MLVYQMVTHQSHGYIQLIGLRDLFNRKTPNLLGKSMVSG